MPYYHVRITTITSKNPYYEWDKTDLSEIKKRIVIPFLKEERVRFSGQFLPALDIRSIVIVESEWTVKEHHHYINEKAKTQGILIIYSPSRIFNEGERYVRNISDRVFEECSSQIQESSALTSDKPSKTMDKSKVFIVHGHDNAAREAAARFVENLGFKAIILHEQASSGQTIIEKIEANSNVGFGIVLYTPCDLGASQKQKDQLKARARQNVVFEHGYLIGKIGRENVCALVKGDIETPNDISGVVYIKMDEGDGWKLAVAKEMKKSGYDVDLNKI
jgi:putative nucleotide-binding protein containing TIR-like domain